MKAAALSLKECYAMLGVAPGADLDAVKHAYRKRAFELHPDLNPGDGASRDFQKLNEAYVTLLRILAPTPTSSPGAGPGNARTGRNAYAEQARRERQEKERREAERRERKEQERRERQEQEREARERREREEKERRETERRERLQREIDRQEAERRERQAKAKADKARRDEAFRAAEREREEKLREAEPRAEAYRRTYGHTRPTASGPEGRTSTAPGGSGAAPGTPPETSATADASREELLHELLNDPFARRVYEDIYSEVRNRQNAPSKPEPQPRKFRMEWGGKAFQVDLTGGIGHALKGWMRNQIDEEQELSFPAANLFPGARIRLQIRHGFSGELRTVDITLPQDFVPGKPVRLKGMGKKLGRWQGDLYLTFQIKERGSS